MNIDKIAISIGIDRYSSPEFDCKFDPDSVWKIQALAEKTYKAIEEFVGQPEFWPKFIDAMNYEEIAEGELKGGGHGLYLHESQSIKINPHMNYLNVYLNFIHENIHHVDRYRPEELVDELTDIIFEKVTGKSLKDL